MEIKFKDYSMEILEDDINGVKESLYELKRTIMAMEDEDEASEIYHRYCDVEDEVINLIDSIVPKGVLN